MTEKSYFWDESGSIGDAVLSPYDAADEFSSVLSRILSSDGTGYVIPGKLNNLEVTEQSPAAAGVSVNTGSAFIRGFNYLNDASANLVIAANASGNPRLDRIILEIDWTNRTVRMGVLQGTPAASPSLPSLTQIFGTSWQISLAYVYVANGFGTITNSEIFDERSFIETAASPHIKSNDNLIRNSELFGWSGNAAKPPWYWHGTTVASNLAVASATRPTQMSRGRAITILTTDVVAKSVTQTFQVAAQTYYAIRGLLKVGQGTATVTITTDSAAPTTITKTVRILNSFLDLKFLYKTEADATKMTITIATRGVASDQFTFGQWIAVQGYVTGPYRQFHELLYDDTDRISDANYSNKDIGASTNFTIDFSADFGGFILDGVRAALAWVEVTHTTDNTSTSSVVLVPQSGCDGYQIYAEFGPSFIVGNRVMEVGWVRISSARTMFAAVTNGPGANFTRFSIGFGGMEV